MIAGDNPHYVHSLVQALATNWEFELTSSEMTDTKILIFPRMSHYGFALNPEFLREGDCRR